MNPIEIPDALSESDLAELQKVADAEGVPLQVLLNMAAKQLVAQARAVSLPCLEPL